MKLLFTHTDLDGLGCQLMLERKFGSNNVTTNVTNYPDIDALVKKTDHRPYDSVFFTDVFIRTDESIETINTWVELCTPVFVFDHHKTSERFEEQISMPDFTYNGGIKPYGDFHEVEGDKRCSTFRVYQWCFPNGDGPRRLAEAINEFDCGGVEGTPGAEFNKFFYTKGREWAYDYLKAKDELLFDNECYKLLQEYSILADKAVERVKENNRQAVIEGKKILVFRSAKYYLNEIFNAFRSEFDLIIAVKGERLSIRAGNTRNVDARVIAEQCFKGGGHPYAAGGSLPFVMKHSESYVLNRLKERTWLFK